MKNAYKIELLVRTTNERAIRLYSKLGFVEEGRFENRVRLPDGSFVDDLAMARFAAKITFAIRRAAVPSYREDVLVSGQTKLNSE